MKSPSRIIAWMLPFLLTGCIPWVHRAKVPVAPSIAQPTPLPPEVASLQISPAVAMIPLQPVTPNFPITTSPPETSISHYRHRRHMNKAPQEATDEIPAVSAIGQLSMGDPADTQRETSNLIASTEQGLNEISRNLNGQQQKTANHIRDFLKEAKSALASGDVDGAHNLAAKAKVLLDELKK